MFISDYPFGRGEAVAGLRETETEVKCEEKASSHGKKLRSLPIGVNSLFFRILSSHEVAVWR
jgi:hypothetical protein